MQSVPTEPVEVFFIFVVRIRAHKYVHVVELRNQAGISVVAMVTLHWLVVLDKGVRPWLDK